jgi:nucleotide-binding universal stress UspA family protein
MFKIDRFALWDIDPSHFASFRSHSRLSSESKMLTNVINQERRELRVRLDQLTEQVHQVVSVCESVYLEGEPAEQISALARDLGADLIITASHHPAFLARLFNLDKAPKIMHRAPLPVLVYHQENT